MSKYLVRSAMSVTFFRMVGVLSAFLINIVLARVLEPDVLGQYFLAYAMAMLLSVIMMFGMKQTTLRLVTKARVSGGEGCVADTINKIAIIILLAISIVSMFMLSGGGVWLSVGVFHSTEIARALTFVLILGVMLAIAPPIGEALKAVRMPVWGAALDNTLSSLLSLIVFILIYLLNYPLDLQAALAVLSVSIMVVVFASLRKLTAYGCFIRRARTCITFRKIYANASPILLINLSTYISANASIWIVGYYLSHEDVAVYGVILKIFNMIALPLLIVNQAIEPSLADLLEKNRRRYLESLLRFSATLALTATMIISVVIFGFGEAMLSVLFGKNFVVGYTALIILLSGNIVNVWTGSCASMAFLAGYQKVLLMNRLVFGFISVILSVVLVSSHGIEGVAVAVSLSIAMSNLVTWLIVKIKMDYDTSATMNITRNVRILRNGDA